MKNNKYSIIGVVFCILFIASDASAWSPFAFDKANQFYETEKYEDASLIYQEILKNKSDRTKVHFNLGDTLYRQGFYDEAEKHFLEALNAKEETIREYALYNLGNTKFRQNELQKAVDYLNKALEINPENKRTELNRDYILKLLKQQQDKNQDQSGKKDEPEEDEKESDETDEDKDQGDEGEKDKEDQPESTDNQDNEGDEKEDEKDKDDKEEQDKDKENSGNDQEDSEKEKGGSLVLKNFMSSKSVLSHTKKS